MYILDPNGRVFDGRRFETIVFAIIISRRCAIMCNNEIVRRGLIIGISDSFDVASLNLESSITTLERLIEDGLKQSSSLEYFAMACDTLYNADRHYAC